MPYAVEHRGKLVDVPFDVLPQSSITGRFPNDVVLKWMRADSTCRLEGTRFGYREMVPMPCPSDFAVLPLIKSWNFVGCSIGSSSGFAPCKILST